LNSSSVLSLTAHWLTPKFERSAMLHAQFTYWFTRIPVMLLVGLLLECCNRGILAKISDVDSLMLTGKALM